MQKTEACQRAVFLFPSERWDKVKLQEARCQYTLSNLHAESYNRRNNLLAYKFGIVIYFRL